MKLIPTPDQLANAGANVFDQMFRGGLADLRRTPAAIIEEKPQCTVYRYLVADEGACRDLPVLLVPPLAAPTLCFDLRRGCSLAEHLLALGHPTYLLEYGEIGYADRDLGLEHWVEDVLPTAIRRVSEDSGDAPVQVVGWCLGGIMALLSVAGDGSLPVNAIATVASPFDFTRVRLLAPLRPMANLTSGVVVSPDRLPSLIVARLQGNGTYPRNEWSAGVGICRPPDVRGGALARCSSPRAPSLEEDEMYLVSPQELAIQHITELRQQAAKQRLADELKSRQARATRRRRTVRERLPFRLPRPARA